MEEKNIYISWSRLGVIICLLIAFYINFDNEYWRKGRIIENDIISYYAYLPAIFIYEDISLKFRDENPDFFSDKLWYQSTENGGRVIKTTMGASFFYFPFFILAHHYAVSSPDHWGNGYTMPYRFSLAMCSLFYFAISLYFLEKLLRKYFPDLVVFFTLLAVGVGTNLINYVTLAPAMSHIFGFFLFSIVIYTFDKWLDSKKEKLLYFLGFFLGLITLLRPTDGIIVLIIPLYKVANISDFKDRFNLIIRHRRAFIKAIIFAFLVFLPQLLYWKYNSGEWLYNSYNDNEHFFFNDPKIIEGLFSYRKGWLLYTPIMAFAILGLFLKKGGPRGLRLLVAPILGISIYVLFSWWAWWYGGSFGMRAMIDLYPLLAMPLAGFIYWTFQAKWPKFLVSAILICLICINLFQAYQYRVGLIHYEAMTKKTYWEMFLKKQHYETYWEDLEVPDYEAAKNGKRDI